MDDLISRQAAIDAVIKHLQLDYEYAWGVREAINALPSAQPEIIHCKDCQWGKEVCGNIECCVDSNIPPEYHGCEWFCPNGERKGEREEE